MSNQMRDRIIGSKGSDNRRLRRLVFPVIAIALMLVSIPRLRAQSYRVLHNFTGGLDGSGPGSGRLLRDGNGNLYGTTIGGGAFGCGLVFKLDGNEDETVLHNFTCGLDGDSPDAGLVRWGDSLYGTTIMGGEFSEGFGLGGEVVFRLGALFKIDSDGNESVLHSFSDPNWPHGDLAQDAQGNFYGTNTSSGGGNGFGAVFKVDLLGNASVLHNFGGEPQDGAYPNGPVVLDADGNIYGTTPQGGDEDCNCGVVFKLDTNNQETVLLKFGNGNGISSPSSPLVVDSNGDVIGTSRGGMNGSGVVFAISKVGGLKILHNFDYRSGASSPGGLISDSSGNLYGTASGGGAFGTGAVFKLSRDGDETILHSFNGTDGSEPSGTLLLDATGNIYGTTPSGGTFGHGVVFEITP